MHAVMQRWQEGLRKDIPTFVEDMRTLEGPATRCQVCLIDHSGPYSLRDKYQNHKLNKDSLYGEGSTQQAADFNNLYSAIPMQQTRLHKCYNTVPSNSYTTTFRKSGNITYSSRNTRSSHVTDVHKRMLIGRANKLSHRKGFSEDTFIFPKTGSRQQGFWTASMSKGTSLCKCLLFTAFDVNMNFLHCELDAVLTQWLVGHGE